MSEVRVVASGIDSLYASVRGELVEGLLQILDDLRKASPDQDIPITISGSTPDMLLRPYGWRGYPFWLSSPRYELCLGAADPFPPAYLQLHAEHIHTLGIERAVDEAEVMLVRDVFPKGCRPIASRVDVFVDEQGWVPQREDFARFHCRGLRRRTFEVPRQMHGYGRRLSGFSFGAGDLVARLYDKTLEMSIKGHTWPELLWRERDPAQPVWRVEVQYRRPVLGAMGLTGMREVVDRRQGLWEYGTRWLSLRVPTQDSNRARWPVAPQWEELAQAPIGGCAQPLIRDRVRQDDVLRLTQGLVGYASSVEAMGAARGVGSALAATVPSVRPYLEHRGASFAELVVVKRERALQVTTPRAPGLLR
jgi:hypothetical protein